MSTITGNDTDEVLLGTNLNDLIYGMGGNDVIQGNDGEDTSTGGAGQDTFVITQESTASDNRITDFTLGTDRIDVSKLGISDFTTLQHLLTYEPATGNAVLLFENNGKRNLTILDNISRDDLIAEDFVFSSVINETPIVGTVGNDDLFGGLGNDVISGGAGSDYIYGEKGDDILYGNTNAINGTVSENDVLFGGEGNDQLFGNGGPDTLYGDAGNDQLFGGSEIDYLFGGDGNDVLNGGTGQQDVLTGGAGADTYVFNHDLTISLKSDSIIDFEITEDKLDVSALGISDFNTIKILSTFSDIGGLIIKSTYSGKDTLVFFNGILPNSLSENNFVFSSSANADNPVFTSLKDDLFGGLGNDTISGGANIDRLFGEQGDDKLYGFTSDNLEGDSTDGADSLYGGAGNDELYGGVGKDILSGDSGNDLLYGGNDNDTLYGGLDNDILNGNAGNDILYGGFGNDTLNGNDGDDVLRGGVGDDIIQGGTGGDTLEGGDGIDTLVYADSTAAVNVNLWNRTVSGGDALNDFINGFENIRGSYYGDDTLVGDAQNNLIDGIGGADTMNGREGNDTYVVDNSSDIVKDRSGIDLVMSSISYTLGSTIENLTLLGVNPVDGTGNALDNIISGNNNNNILNGGDGIDTVSYGNASAGVTVSLGNINQQDTIGAGKDTLLNFENIVGSAFNDTLTGNANANNLIGGAGADTLDGGLGVDTFTFNSKQGVDVVKNFTKTTEKLLFSQASLKVGDGDLVVEGGVVRSTGTGGFSNTAELVVMQKDIIGSLTAVKAAAVIGSATANYAVGDTALFVVDNNASSGVFLFTSANADAQVTAGELSFLGVVSLIKATTLANFGFVE